MNYKSVNWILIILVVLMTLVFGNNFIKNSKNANEYEASIKAHELKNEGFETILKAQWELENRMINLQSQLYDEKSDMFYLSDKIDPKGTFILYFKWDQCQDCINQEIDFIEKTFKKLPILILITFDGMANFLAYKSSWTHEYPLYYVPNNQSLYEGFRQSYGVHTFVAKEGMITHPHIASASYPELSEIYYNVLFTKYEKDAN